MYRQLEAEDESMDKLPFDLERNEKIILSEKWVTHYPKIYYNDDLYMTNRRVIFVKRSGLLMTVKKCLKYDFSDITDLAITKDSRGYDVLTIYHDGTEDTFGFNSDGDAKTKIWSIAYTDLKYDGDNEIYNSTYYHSLYENRPKDEFEQMIDKLKSKFDERKRLKEEASNDEVEVNAELVGDLLKGMLKPGGFSARSMEKTLKKASKKQLDEKRKARRGSDFIDDFKSDVKDAVKDSLGITEIQDEFTEIGNEFRSFFGMKPKKTQRQMREEREAEKAQNDAMLQEIKKIKEANQLSLTEQAEAVRKLKELMDDGIISRAEFEKKKRKILGL